MISNTINKYYFLYNICHIVINAEAVKKTKTKNALPKTVLNISQLIKLKSKVINAPNKYIIVKTTTYENIYFIIFYFVYIC